MGRGYPATRRISERTDIQNLIRSSQKHMKVTCEYLPSDFQTISCVKLSGEEISMQGFRDIFTGKLTLASHMQNAIFVCMRCIPTNLPICLIGYLYSYYLSIQ